MILLLLAALALGAEVPATPEEAYQRVFNDLFDLDKVEPFDQAEVELGKLLFFDPRLAGSKAMSCASCHNPGLAWGDGLVRGRGAGGKELLRNTPSLLNVHRNIPEPFFLDGRAATIEEAALTALESRLEMNRDARQLLLDLGRLPGYARRFDRIYPKEGMTKATIGRALGAYVRAGIRPGVTAFDVGLASMTAEAKSGLMLFTGKARCLLCHTGSFFSDDFFHNVGVKPLPDREDPGRYAVVKGPHTWRAFRTPPLRDVARTGPYMHDGSLASLRDVIEFYDRGGDDPNGRDNHMEPLKLTAREKNDLVAFLESLTTLEPRPVLHPVLPAQEEPLNIDEARRRVAQRAARLRRAKDRAAVWAQAMLLREEAALLKDDCVPAVDRRAYDLAEAAGRGAPLSSKAVDAALKTCRLEPGVATVDEAIRAAESLLAGAARSCDVSEVPKLVGDIAARRFGDHPSERMEEVLRFDLLRFYEYRALLDGGVERCKELKVPKIYFGIFREGEWACAERHYENELASAFVTRPADFEAKCRASVQISYPRMDKLDAGKACALLAKNLDEPDPCGKLLNVYLSEDKLASCRNQFRRMRGFDDPKTCSAFDGAPTQWKDRCLALSAFTRAWKAKDASVCGTHALCSALMGDRKASVEKTAAVIREKACGVLAEERRHADVDDLLHRGLAMLAEAEASRPAADLSAARSIDERLERIARLRLRSGSH